MAYSMMCVCVCPYLLLCCWTCALHRQVICAKGDDVGSSEVFLSIGLPKKTVPTWLGRIATEGPPITITSTNESKKEQNMDMIWSHDYSSVLIFAQKILVVNDVNILAITLIP